MIDLVIINWNAGVLIKNCVESALVPTNKDEVGKIIIVDNASSDGSLEQLPKDEKIQIIKNSENKGFSSACNTAFRNCNSKYILLLNPDTVLFPDTLVKCKIFMDRNQDVDLMGCQLLTRRGNISVSCARFPTPLRFFYDASGLSFLFPKIFTPALLMTDWDHKNSTSVDQVMGAFMFFPKSIFEKIGYFDEQFFVYYEELDFCKRLRNDGGKIWFNADIQCYHIGMGTTAKITAFRLFLSLSSRLKYSKKHFSKTGYGFVVFSTFIVEPVTRTFHTLFSRGFQEVQNVWKGYYMLIRKRS